MDKHTLRVLEFSKILKMAGSFAITAPGKTVVQNIKPLSDIESIRSRLDLVSEGRRLLSEGRQFGIEHFEDLSPLFQRLRPVDPVLDSLELRQYLPLFSSAINLKRLLKDEAPLPQLCKIASRLRTHPLIKRGIESSIDREGRILDAASPELAEIRHSIKSLEKRIKGLLEGILRRRELKPHIQDFYITERNGRWVIPVRSDSKGRLHGVVHDISNTGETLFIEPYETQPPGNELESMRAEEKVEEFRVLKRLSNMLREAVTEIEADFHTVLGIDSIQAFSAFSEMMGMTAPEINEEGQIKIIEGRHPLLWKTLRKLNRETELVPLNFELDRNNTCMVITGSNTGGKTVALKTVGVLHLMALSGMHLPAESGTTIPFLRMVLADIGDEQSIEQNLSTFSAHITRISEIIKKSDSDTLVIIDELGTGTDPDEGGPLSCAILRELKRRGTFTAVSTHLGFLKAFAYSEPGMINGAMEMEALSSDGTSNYCPTYRLIIGEIGRSHAFEIAGRLGLPEGLIKEAMELVKDEGVRVETMLSELMRRNQELGKRLEETGHLKQELIELRASLKEELERIRTLKREALSRSLREAEEIIRKAKREAREIIEEIKRSELKSAGEIVKDLDRKLVKLKEMGKLHHLQKVRKLKEAEEGQRVLIRSLRVNGVIHSVNRKAGRCRVVVKGREIEVPLEELAVPSVSASEGVEDINTTSVASGAEIDKTEDRALSGELNLIGQRVDPALSVLERYLNDASVAGLTCVKIVHGLGTGRLSRAIRDYLKDHPLVRSFRKGNEDEGGEAVTVVYLKED